MRGRKNRALAVMEQGLNAEENLRVRALRRRGRPRKDNDNGLQEEKRARGRKAQKNYQLRKQAESTGLKYRITLLEHAIESMSNEFIDFGARIANTQSQPQVLLKDMKDTTERFLEIARTAESTLLVEDLELESGQHYQEDQVLTTQRREPRPITPRDVLQNYFLQGPIATNVRFNALLAAATPPDMARYEFGQDNSSISNSGRFSPRLGYGLLGASPNDPIPESLWSHYFVAGPKSFAKRLYLDAVKLISGTIKGDFCMPGFLTSIGRFRFRHEDPRILISLIDEISSRHGENVEPGPEEDPSEERSVVLFGPSDQVMSTSLRRNIFIDATRELGSIKDFLDPWATQQYLTSQWGMQLTSASIQVSTNTLRSLNFPIPIFDNSGKIIGISSIAGNISEQIVQADFPNDQPNRISYSDTAFEVPEVAFHFDLIVSAQYLAHSLISDAICFGEGPRFLRQNIDKAALELLSNLATSEGILAIPVI